MQRCERRWLTAAIAERRGTEPLAGVDPAILDSLPTLTGRRRLPKQARRTDGRAGKKAMAARQRQALDVI